MIRTTFYVTAIGVLLCFFLSSCNSSDAGSSARTREDCLVCDRLSLFLDIKSQAAQKYWPAFDSDKFTPPLVYFSDSQSWLAFSPIMLFNDSGFEKKECPSGIVIYKMSKRPDQVAFHMENKMSLTDSTLPYYYNPILFCSGVEQAKKQVAEVTGTEEWLQMVMHEYFHAFQFSHENTIRYLADSVTVQADSLHNVYLSNKWFRDYLGQENELLLKALAVSTDDSARFYCTKFSEVRKLRRQFFARMFKYDITRQEKFWETIEGTARYMEYNLGFIYMNQVSGQLHLECDSMFRNFGRYQNSAFLEQPWFREKTEMITAYYYYVTGLNLCRVMDRLHINYKEKVNNDVFASLEDLFNQNLIAAEEQYQAPADAVDVRQ